MANDNSDLVSSIESDSILKTLDQDAKKLSKVSFGRDSNFEQAFDKYKDTMQQSIASRDATQIQGGIDGMIKQGQDFRAIVSEMNVNLSKYFTDINEKMENISEYQGLMENAAAKFGQSLGWKGAVAWANRRVYDRMKTHPIDKSTTQMLLHGKNIVGIINREIGNMEKATVTVTKDLDNVTRDYDLAQGKYTEWHGLAEKKKAELSELEEKLQYAEDTAVKAGLQKKVDTARKVYDDASIKADQFQVVVTKSNEQRPILQKHLESYVQIIKDLKNMRTNIQQDVAHYANVLPNVQKVYETLTSVKGADQFGEQMRATVKGATDFVVKSAREVAAIGEKMLKSQPVSPEEYDKFTQILIDATSKYESGFAAAAEKNADPYKVRSINELRKQESGSSTPQ